MQCAKVYCRKVKRCLPLLNQKIKSKITRLINILRVIFDQTPDLICERKRREGLVISLFSDKRSTVYPCPLAIVHWRLIMELPPSLILSPLKIQLQLVMPILSRGKLPLHHFALFLPWTFRCGYLCVKKEGFSSVYRRSVAPNDSISSFFNIHRILLLAEGYEGRGLFTGICCQLCSVAFHESNQVTT